MTSNKISQSKLIEAVHIKTKDSPAVGAGQGAGGWKVHLAKDNKHLDSSSATAAAKRQRPSMHSSLFAKIE